jgi:hypothetical protein
MNLNPNDPNDPNNRPKPDSIEPSALEAISRAEIDMAIATARRYPQHQPGQLSTVKQAMMTFATLDEETAASCFYSLPRGGKTIQGPSVRLAEIALSCYGNCRAGSRIISTVSTGDSPHVVVQAVVMDLEKNIAVSIEKRRRIVGKKSRNGAIDEDDINLATNACSAIALRDATFKVVPLALVKPVFEAARRVAIGDAKTLNTRRQQCIDAFAKMGVTKERILSKMEVKAVSDITLEHLETLIGLFNAIKEGELIDDVFATDTAEKKADLSDLEQPTAPAKQPEPSAKQPEPAKQQPATVADIAKAIAAEGLKAAEAEPPAKTLAEHQAEKEKAMAAKPEDAPQAQTKAKPQEKTQAAPQAAPEDPGDAKEALKSVLLLLGEREITPEQCMAWARATKVAKPEQKKLNELATPKLLTIAKLLENNPKTADEIKATQA